MSDALNRYYALEIPQAVVDALSEGLTNLSPDDLATGHLSRNYAYFGGIDKTLCGFVVLDDEGDDHTLIDLRGGGQVWWQDHETREVHLEFDDLKTWQDAAAAVEEAQQEDEDVDSDDIKDGFRSSQPRLGAVVVPTPVLLQRYQWLVWALAMPMRNRGVVVQSPLDLINDALGRFPFDGAAAVDSAFEAELVHLADDPHLAVYWLLHATMQDEPGRRQQVLAAVGSTEVPLVQAFIDSDLAVVPDLGARRGLVAVSRASRSKGEISARHWLRALQLDPEHWGWRKAVPVAEALVAGTLSADEVAQALETTASSPATSLLRATLDQLQGAAHSEHADAAARALVDVEWQLAFSALWPIHALVGDTEALQAVAAASFAGDPHHPRILRLCRATAARTGTDRFGTDAALEQAIALAESSVVPMRALVAADADVQAIVGPLTPELSHLVARRLALRAVQFGAAPLSWAIERLLASDDPERGSLLQLALRTAPAQVRRAVLPELAKAVDRPDHPVLDALLGVLADLDNPPEGDFSAKYGLQAQVEALASAIAPFAHVPPVFDRWMTVLEEAQVPTVADRLIQQLLNPFEEDSFVIGRLDDAQAVRVATALIALRYHDDIHLRNTAGHQLYRFAHPGGRAVCIAGLEEHSARFADNPDDSNAKDVVANLYNVVRALGATDALVEQLFTERRSYWRLGNAVAEGFCPELDALAMERLRTGHHAQAASAYMASLAQHLKQDAPQIALAREVASWPVPDDPQDRRLLTYVCKQGVVAALASKRGDVVRTVWGAIEALDAEPYSPYHSVDRDRAWADPFAEGGDDAVKAALQSVLSGSYEQGVAALRSKGQAARAAGKPLKRIGDDDLSMLAGATICSRWTHNPVTQAMLVADREGGLHYFDGYDVVPAPFEIVADATQQPRSFLEGATEVSERLMLWNGSGARFEEWVRYGDRVLAYRGANNGALETVGLAFPDAPAAAGWLDAIRKHPPKKMVVSDPWYLAGKGAVVRSWYRPKADGSYDKNGRQLQAILGGRLCWGEQTLGEGVEPVAYLDTYDLETLRDHGGRVNRIEWMERLRRDDDLSLEEWLSNRRRQDGRSAAWHLEALRDVPAYLEQHGLSIAGLEVTLAPPAPTEALARFEAAFEHADLTPLVELWRSYGGARWTLDSHIGELLGPAEALAARLDNGAVPIARVDGEVVSIVADRKTEDGRVFSSAPDFDWWEVSLGWILCTDLTHLFEQQILAADPELRGRWFGQSRGELQRAHLRKDDKGVRISLDPTARVVATHTAKDGTPGSWKVQRYATVKAAHKAFDAAVARRHKSGFAEQP